MKIQMKAIQLSGLVIILFSLFISNSSKGQYRNYERLFGKENPYVSFVKGDSIYTFQKTDSSIQLVDKIETQQKILKDLRVINRNQNTLEVWLFASLLLNVVCIVLVVRVMLKQRKNQD